MKQITDLNELEKGSRIEADLAVKDKEAVRTYKDGNFFSLELGNRTGKVIAKYWGGKRKDVQEVHDKISVGDIVHIKGSVGRYRDHFEISLDPSEGKVLDKVPSEEHDPREFLPTIDENPEHLFSDISRKIRELENPHLKELCMKFYGDKEIAPELKKAPAAKSYHHNRIGGYIQHIHETMHLAESFCELHPQIDREILLVGVLLHDIGKIDEYDYGTAIDFTDDGRLLGHIPIGDHMVSEAISEIDGFPEDLERKVRHMVLSHHGRKEWGSAVEPRTKEAIVLHELEHLDSRVSKVMGAFKKHEESGETGVFDPALKQYIYLK